MATRKSKPSVSIGIVYREHTEKAIQAAIEVTNWLRERKHTVYTLPDQQLIPHTTLLKTPQAWKKIPTLSSSVVTALTCEQLPISMAEKFLLLGSIWARLGF